uniref:Uncharacterized protein n=1 Tax=Arundo donax TaxID=35708 RepID=A0A0A9HN34_ARUDO
MAWKYNDHMELLKRKVWRLIVYSKNFKEMHHFKFAQQGCWARFTILYTRIKKKFKTKRDKLDPQKSTRTEVNILDDNILNENHSMVTRNSIASQSFPQINTLEKCDILLSKLNTVNIKL